MKYFATSLAHPSQRNIKKQGSWLSPIGEAKRTKNAVLVGIYTRRGWPEGAEVPPAVCRLRVVLGDTPGGSCGDAAAQRVLVARRGLDAQVGEVVGAQRRREG